MRCLGAHEMWWGDIVWEYINAYWDSLVVQRLKHLSAMWETWVRSLGWKDPLEKEMATHASILAWKIPWTEESDKLQFMGSQKSQHNLATKQQQQDP